LSVKLGELLGNNKLLSFVPEVDAFDVASGVDVGEILCGKVAASSTGAGVGIVDFFSGATFGDVFGQGIGVEVLGGAGWHNSGCSFAKTSLHISTNSSTSCALHEARKKAMINNILTINPLKIIPTL
jgi:hypothetical protein